MQLQPRDLAVDLLRDVIDLPAQLGGMVQQILQRQRLHGEARVHDLGRVAVAGGQIHQAALGQQVQRAAVRQLIARNVLPARIDAHRHIRQRLAVDLDVEMARVREEGVILHDLEMPARQHVAAAGRRDEQVALRGSLVHGHDAAAVHGGLERLDGVDLRDDNVRAHALCAHGHTASAVAVARDNDGLARDEQVRRVHDGVPHGLARAVLVVIIMLALRIVDVHHREGQHPGAGAGVQAVDAGRRLLRAAEQVFAQMRIVPAQQVQQVAAVVDDEIRAARERLDEQAAVFRCVHAVHGIGLHAHGRKARRHVVLRGQGIAARGMHLRAACRKAEREEGRFGLHVDGNGDLLPGEGLFALKARTDRHKGGHKILHPADLHPAGLGKGHIADMAHGDFLRFWPAASRIFCFSAVIIPQRRFFCNVF